MNDKRDVDNELNDKLLNIIELVNQSDISSIKSVVSNIINIINDPNSNARDLKKGVEIDPPLTAKVLRVANSAYYGSRRKINEIAQAVIWIGFDAVKELVLNQKVCEIFNKQESFKGYSRIALWKHSVAVALLVKMIFRREFGEKGDDAYVAGLLHDIGIIAEDQFIQGDFRKVLERSENENKNLVYMEDNVLGFNHANVGMAISKNWNFPEELVNAIGYHHNPIDVPADFSKLTLTLHVADLYCQKNNIGYVDSPFQDKVVLQTCLDALELEPYAIDLIMEDLIQEISKMEEQGVF